MNSNSSIAQSPAANGPFYRRHLAIAGCISALLGAGAWLNRSANSQKAISESSHSHLSSQRDSTYQVTEVSPCHSDPASCVSLGSRILGREATRAAHLFHAACEAGHPLGCNDLGVLYRDGIGLQQDPVRAARYFEQACADDSAEGCNNLGVLKQRGLGTNLDSERARALYRQACELGST
ncbi:MAG TPA: tetratricopeptide repeat protein, partial [Polyangiaceae bacterium]|nr:tetratricopeptide repeat protein [Polyangiaceae bacterium]